MAIVGREAHVATTYQSTASGAGHASCSPCSSCTDERVYVRGNVEVCGEKADYTSDQEGQ